MTAEPSTRLARRLGFGDAVVLGVGSMLGAGIYVATAPAAEAAAAGILLSLPIAALVAACNATSSARLAARIPESGGTYAYGRVRLGERAGFLAGWCFLAGKIASCAALALAFATYVAPSAVRGVAIALVVAVVALNYLGVEKTAAVAKWLLAIVLACLIAALVAMYGGGELSSESFSPFPGAGTSGLLEGAAILFFAFAGYARIATLGEEVRRPRTTIPAAIAVALALVVGLYALVVVATLGALGVPQLADASAPVRAAVEAGTLDWLSPVARIGAAVATAGVLVSLLAGVSRTMFAMAATGDLPRALSAVHPRYRVPHRADLAVGLLVGVLVLAGNLRVAIGVSAFLILAYYAITNLAALTLRGAGLVARAGVAVAVLGLIGCVALAVTLPVGPIAAGAAVMLVGLLVYSLPR